MLTTLDPTHKARFEAQWALVDRIFKLVQWVLIVAVVAALPRRVAGTGSLWMVVLVGLILPGAWLFALGCLLTAYLASWFPDVTRYRGAPGRLSRSLWGS